MRAREVDHRPDLRLAVALAIVVTVTAGGLVAWTLSVRDRLPDPVARHWGIGGAADGFSSLAATLWTSTGLLLVVVAPLASAAVLSRQPATLRRCLAGIAGGLSVFLAAVFVDGLRQQVDLTDAALAPAPGPGLLVGTVGGLAVGLGLAALVRTDAGRAVATTAPPAAAPRLATSTSAPRWTSPPAAMDRGAAALTVVTTLGMVALSLAVSLWFLPLTLLLTALLAGIGRVRTSVDTDGLQVRAFGWRLLHVPIAEVAEADVVDVDPFWEFGGWGLRIDVHGRTGVVTRKGPAVRVRRGDDTEVLVTVDDADRAAATLNTLADQVARR